MPTLVSGGSSSQTSGRIIEANHWRAEKWLTTYIDANPNRSTYAFCLDTKHPGYFYLCFKASRGSKVNAWMIRVIPHAYELLKSQYPDMRALCNGFKLRYQSEMLKMQGGGGPRGH